MVNGVQDLLEKEEANLSIFKWYAPYRRKKAYEITHQTNLLLIQHTSRLTKLISSSIFIHEGDDAV